MALGLIVLSAGRIQGSWHSSCVSRLTTAAPCFSNLVQKLFPYRYHIGGVLTLAGIVYGGCRAWGYIFPHYDISFFHWTNLSMNKMPMNDVIDIYSVSCNGKKLSSYDVRKTDWT